MVVVCRDVTERRRALSKLAYSEHLVRTLIETSSNGILRFGRDADSSSPDYHCVFANRAAESFIGEQGGEQLDTLVGKPLVEFDYLEPEKLLEHFATDTSTESSLSFEVTARCTDGDSWLRVVAEPVGDDFSVTLVDITKHKHDEDKMLADALRDPLTGMLNRRGFELQAEQRITDCSNGAVLYLDLNQFKLVNDKFGHQAGDALLKAFGHRLEFCLRPEDILGRLGGDEFGIVLPDVNVADVQQIAERLVHTASEAYILRGQKIICTVSVGIALMPKHGEELWHLLSVADAAMYVVKQIPEADAANDRSAYIVAATAS
jgi:diguanylate cyclase (GGDEF)-like protein